MRQDATNLRSILLVLGIGACGLDDKTPEASSSGPADSGINTPLPDADADTDADADADADADTDTDTDADSDADTDADSDADTDADSDADTDADTDTDVEAQVVRFIALGDGGEGNDAQYQVATAMQALCAEKADDDGAGCDFALYLGDNFYDDGVESVDDPQFETKFELPYAEIDFPFYVVLGNHDYGEVPVEFWRTDYQVEYTAYSTKWNMPDKYYSYEEDHVQFIGLDTNDIMVFGGSAQESWISGVHATSTSEWKIAFGHHPYVSNGRHGNAGTYEGIPGIPIVSGESVKEFFDDNICGMTDVYFSGHDHNRQWLWSTCGTNFIVTGAASKTTDLVGRGSPTYWEEADSPGFMWVEIRDNVLTGEFYDQYGTLDYTNTIVK